MYKTKNIEKWHNYNFESIENRPAKDFANFARNIKAEINAQIKNSGYVLKVFIRGYYEISGFICSEDNRCMYFSIGDVRYDKNWYNNVLVREANNTHDYTGGRNNFVKLSEFEIACRQILSKGRSKFAA